MTEMDISLVVFVLLQIFKTYKAEENCTMQYCQSCPNEQTCNYCELGRFGQKCENQCQANYETCTLCRDLWYFISLNSKEECFGCKTNEYILNGTCVPCHEGYFGTNCSETCPENCLQCDSQVICTSCRNGWSGEVCQCSTNCKQEGQEDEWCDENGFCLKGCKSGTRGNRCDLECGNKEKCLSCNQINGECLNCSEGWYGSSCNKKCGHCQPNKEGLTKCNISTGECNDTCVDGYYGLLCDKRCGQCLPNENDSSINCDQISGNCSFRCKQGWFGETCENSCRSYCFNRTCYQLSGKCSERCVHGWNSDLCKTKCNHTCTNGSCDAFSSICKEGCVSGWYGSTCNEMCNVACVNMSCEQDSGYCDYGCVSGWYGPTCNKTCNAACVNTSCYQDSGHCDYGCVSGWHGEKCEYGCSKSCKEDICDRQTAKCSFGCKTYFKGPLCNDTGTLVKHLNPVFIKVIIGTAGSILLIACVLVALLLVRKRVCRHGKAAVDSTVSVYDEIDDTVLEETFMGEGFGGKLRRERDRSLKQISNKRTVNCETGIYDLPTETRSFIHKSMTGTNFDIQSGTFQTQALDIHTTMSDSSNSGYEIPLSAKDMDKVPFSNHFTEYHIFGSSENLCDKTDSLCSNSRKSQANEYMEFGSKETAKVKSIQSTSQRNLSELQNQDATTCKSSGERNSCTYLHPIS